MILRGLKVVRSDLTSITTNRKYRRHYLINDWTESVDPEFPLMVFREDCSSQAWSFARNIQNSMVYTCEYIPSEESPSKIYQPLEFSREIYENMQEPLSGTVFANSVKLLPKRRKK